MKIGKGILIGVVAFALSFGTSFFVYRSCTNTTLEEKVTMVGDTVTSEGKVMEFEYENHKFINIVKATDEGSESFVVHDPNCKCTSKKLNNITTVITNTDNKNSRSSDSIAKANFRVIISKLSQLDTEVKTLRNEIAELKKMKVNPVWKTQPNNTKKVVKKSQPVKKTKK